MRRLCHLLPWLALAGCFSDHAGTECPTRRVCCDATGVVVPYASDCSCPPGATERTACVESDAGPARDAGRARDAGARDAGPRRDGGSPPPPPPPPPPECAPARGTTTCLGSTEVAPGVPFALPVRLGGCGCCPGTHCAVAVDAASRTIDLATSMCPDPCDCDSCRPVTATCDVPGLSEGDWTVRANGAPAFTLPVRPIAPGLLPPPPTCVTYAQVDECSEPLPGARSPIDEVCVEHLFGRVQLRLEERCPACPTYLGTCAVTVEPRFTDDLPPGGEIHVDARRFEGACDGTCDRDPACFPSTRSCEVPALDAGSFYRVWVDGVEVVSFTEGAIDETPCGAVP